MTGAHELRLARCPGCGFERGVPATMPTAQKLCCSRCSARFRLRHAIGDRRCPWRPPSVAKRAERAAAAEINARYGELPADSVDDLFRSPPV